LYPLGAFVILRAMMDKPVYLASDAHLGAAPPPHEGAFLAWLASTADTASRVVLNGDVFDFWFEYVWGTTGGHDAAFQVIREVIAAGVPVTMMGGNHDWWGGRFLRDEVGVEFLQEPVVRDLAGYRVFLGHGDGLGPGDRGYHFMKWVLRGRLTRLAFSLLPPALGDRVAEGVSSTRDRWGGVPEKDRVRARVLSDWAAGRLEDEPELDLVILGHTHQPEVREVGGGRWYVNLGDWVQHRTYAVLQEGRPPQLMEWEA
jgi:UDP-2,3-diacylglucosamine hydrolase